MASERPLLLVDNVFDATNLYPTAVLSSTGDAAGRSVRAVSDYRRERTFWQAATSAADRDVRVDLGSGNSRLVDSAWLDRGHNLWGLTVRVDASDASDFSTGDGLQWVVPAEGTVGGDPTAGWCVTEEGALYTLFSGFSARRYFRVRVVSAAQPILTGVIVGARTQLAVYSRQLDEDAGERNERMLDSDAMYSAVDRVYSRRTLNLDLAVIGASSYDAQIRSLRGWLFERNQPVFVVMNYGTKPERGWLYQYAGRSWSFGADRSHRKGSIPLRELGPLIR